MKITESQLRSFIRKSLLTEAAKGPQDLPDKLIIKVYDDFDGGSASYLYTAYSDPLENTMKSPVQGLVRWRKVLGDKPNEITLTSADRGWGPLLYDIAIEMSGDLGIMSDRWEVSPDAQAIWNYYKNNRSDIEKIQLDNKKNELTKTVKDNVDQDMAEQDPAVEKWFDSSMSKAYRSHGTPTIDKLKALNKIVIIGSK